MCVLLSREGQLKWSEWTLLPGYEYAIILKKLALIGMWVAYALLPAAPNSATIDPCSSSQAVGLSLFMLSEASYQLTYLPVGIFFCAHSGQCKCAAPYRPIEHIGAAAFAPPIARLLD